MTQEEELRAGASVTGCWGRTRPKMRQNMDIVLQGWLTKSPPEKFWKAKWRKRYFILRQSGELPNQYLLEYYTDSCCNKLKGRVDLDQCEQVDAGLHGANSKFSYNHLFDIRTPKRVYYLAADSEIEMTRWVDTLCHVCGLKPYNREDEYYEMPPVVSNDPTTSTTTTTLAESQFHPAPVTCQPPVVHESPVTGPYIPLNQCLSRAPEKSPTTPGNDSVFTDDDNPTPIPPVNWDTFPRGNSDSSGPGDDLPPRPPKPPGLTALSYLDAGSESDNVNARNRCSERHKSSPTTRDGDVFRYDFAPGTSPSIESGLGSSGGRSPPSAGLYNDSGRAPPANRDRKPGKSAMTPPPPGVPVVDRALKPAAIKGISLDQPPKRAQRAAPSPTPPLHDAPHPMTNDLDYFRIQYLDLSFPPDGATGSSPHHSPLSVGDSQPDHTVYKTIDHVRTQALNLVKIEREKEKTHSKGGND